MKIAFVGECMIELREQGTGSLAYSYAGDVLNAAVYCRRELGTQPLTTAFVTALGRDSFSHAMLQFWQREKIDCTYVRQLPDKQPGLYLIQTAANGERSFVYWRNDSAARYMFNGADGEQLLQRLGEFDGIYVSGITLAILADGGCAKLLSALEQLKVRGGQVYFDTNFRPRLWSDLDEARRCYDRVLQLADIAFVTLEDAQLLYGIATVEQVLARCAGFTTPELVLKCGAEPCHIRHRGQVISVPAQPVANVVDTTAAGDAFSGAYLAARLLGQSPEPAAKAAHALAARVIACPGAIIPNDNR